MKADKIYLVGFMAAGKTTVARALARRVQVHTNPAAVRDILEHAVAARKINFAVAQIVDARKKARSSRIFGVYLAVVFHHVGSGLGPPGILVIREA